MKKFRKYSYILAVPIYINIFTYMYTHMYVIVVDLHQAMW